MALELAIVVVGLSTQLERQVTVLVVDHVVPPERLALTLAGVDLVVRLEMVAIMLVVVDLVVPVKMLAIMWVVVAIVDRYNSILQLNFHLIGIMEITW